MLRSVKITDTIKGITTVKYIVQCPKCKKDHAIPETYYSWWMRSLGMEPTSVLHRECGGPLLSDFFYVSDWWAADGICSVGTPSGYNSGCSSVDHESNRISSLIKTEDKPRITEPYKVTYVYKTFWDAHNTLKSFIVQENNDAGKGRLHTDTGQSEIVEPSVSDGPEVHEDGPFGGI